MCAQMRARSRGGMLWIRASEGSGSGGGEGELDDWVVGDRIGEVSWRI